tara:strand:+ start:1070 stop:1288 length:219 start_codon:yes stop_codon:yes gene_type:complete
MTAILQKSFLWMSPGTVFKLKTHEDREDIEIFLCEDLDEEGKEFWLSRGFVLGEFESGYEPQCWTDDLFLIV